MAEGGRGRVLVGAEVDRGMVEAMDAAARERGLKRSDVIRDWLRRGAEAYERERGLLRQLAGGR